MKAQLFFSVSGLLEDRFSLRVSHPTSLGFQHHVVSSLNLHTEQDAGERSEEGRFSTLNTVVFHLVFSISAFFVAFFTRSVMVCTLLDPIRAYLACKFYHSCCTSACMTNGCPTIERFGRLWYVPFSRCSPLKPRFCQFGNTFRVWREEQCCNSSIPLFVLPAEVAVVLFVQHAFHVRSTCR